MVQNLGGLHEGTGTSTSSITFVKYYFEYKTDYEGTPRKLRIFITRGGMIGGRGKGGQGFGAFNYWNENVEPLRVYMVRLVLFILLQVKILHSSFIILRSSRMNQNLSFEMRIFSDFHEKITFLSIFDNNAKLLLSPQAI